MALLALTVAMAALLPALASAHCTPKCPNQPLDECDFYFEGYENTIPTFDLNKHGNDQDISPYIVCGSGNKQQKVEVDESGETTLLGCNIIKNQRTFTYPFYASGQNAKLKFRTFNKPLNKSDFTGKCIKLVLRNYVVGGKRNGKKQPCIIFKT